MKHASKVKHGGTLLKTECEEVFHAAEIFRKTPQNNNNLIVVQKAF